MYFPVIVFYLSFYTACDIYSSQVNKHTETNESLKAGQE